MDSTYKSSRKSNIARRTTNRIWKLLLLLVLIGLLNFDNSFSVEIKPVFNRETIVIDVNSPDSETDSTVTACLKKALSARFDIADSMGMYTIRLRGWVEDKEDTMFKVIGVSFTSTDSNVYYDAILDSPEMYDEMLFEKLAVEPDWLLGTLGDEENIASKILAAINKRYPPTGWILTVEGNEAVISMGARAGLVIGDRITAYIAQGKPETELEVMSVTDSTAVSKVVHGAGIQPRDQVRLRTRLSKLNIGLEYTHFQVRRAGSWKIGRQMMFNLSYSLSPRGRFLLQGSTGYVDLIEHSGWHLVNVDLISRLPLSPDRFYLEAGVGGGVALVRLTQEVDPATKERLKPLGVGIANIYGGGSYHFTRRLAVTFGLGYVAYTRYLDPYGPSLKAGMRFFGI